VFRRRILARWIHGPDIICVRHARDRFDDGRDFCLHGFLDSLADPENDFLARASDDASGKATSSRDRTESMPQQTLRRELPTERFVLPKMWPASSACG